MRVLEASTGRPWALSNTTVDASHQQVTERMCKLAQGSLEPIRKQIRMPCDLTDHVPNSVDFDWFIKFFKWWPYDPWSKSAQKRHANIKSRPDITMIRNGLADYCSEVSNWAAHSASCFGSDFKRSRCLKTADQDRCFSEVRIAWLLHSWMKWLKISLLNSNFNRMAN